MLTLTRNPAQPPPAAPPSRTVSSRRRVRPLAAGVVGLALTTLTLAACHRGGAATVSTDTGISGIALAGPQCPVERQGSPCPPKPVSARIIVKDSSGTEVTAFNSGPDGRFRVELAPGRYVLVTADQLPPTLKPQEVTVVSGQFTDVQLNLDTGIR